MQNFKLTGTGILRLSKWAMNGNSGFSMNLVIEDKITSAKGTTVKSSRIPIEFVNEDDKAKLLQRYIPKENEPIDLIINLPDTVLFINVDKNDKLTAYIDKYEIVG